MYQNVIKPSVLILHKFWNSVPINGMLAFGVFSDVCVCVSQSWFFLIFFFTNTPHGWPGLFLFVVVLVSPTSRAF